MSIASIAYMFLLVVMLLVFHLFSNREIKGSAIAAGGLILLFSQATSPIPLIVILIFVVIGYLLAVFSSHMSTFPARLSSCLIFIAIFLLSKQYWFVPNISFLTLFSTIGMSYILLRGIHVILEAGDSFTFSWGSFGSYLRFQVNPFSLLSGPVNRYDDFLDDESEWDNIKLTQSQILTVLIRMAWGLIKVLLLSPVVYSWFVAMPETHGDMAIAPAAALFIVYVYLNFSGTMDIVIPIARFFGYDLPENFDRPWMARNFIDFWSRWHITLSNFLRDNVFFPVLKFVAEKGAGRSGLLIGNLIGGFFAFILMGLWHGTQYMFFWLGIFLAIGITINRLWEWIVTKDDFGSYTWLVQDIAGALAWFYFGIAAISVWPNINSLTDFLNTISRITTIDGILGAFLALFGLILARRMTTLIDKFPILPNAYILPAKQAVLVVSWIVIVMLFANALSEISTFNYYANIT